MRRGIAASEQAKNRLAESPPQPQSGVLRLAHADDNLVRSAERRYLQEHSQAEYEQLLKRLFDESFPAE